MLLKIKAVNEYMIGFLKEKFVALWWINRSLKIILKKKLKILFEAIYNSSLPNNNLKHFH